MSEGAFERYKDALRRGHLAVRKGRLEVALAAWTEAAEIAPDRALPLVGLGDTLRSLGRLDEALAAYDAALERAPADEPALRARAEVLAALGRRVEAAEGFDRLAEVQEAAGHVGEAIASTRRALEQAESRSRRSRLRRLGGDDAGPDVLVAPEIPGPILVESGEARLEAGDTAGALADFRAAVAAHRRDGQIVAALDACHLALRVAPADPEIHLTLAELYLERGWRPQAADKLVLLARLADLDAASSVRARLCRLASERFMDDPRLVSICA